MLIRGTGTTIYQDWSNPFDGFRLPHWPSHYTTECQYIRLVGGPAGFWDNLSADALCELGQPTVH